MDKIGIFQMKKSQGSFSLDVCYQSQGQTGNDNSALCVFYILAAQSRQLDKAECLDSRAHSKKSGDPLSNRNGKICRSKRSVKHSPVEPLSGDLGRYFLL